MKLFDPRAALAEIAKQTRTPATSATSATQPTENPPYVANVANVATPRTQIEKITPVDNQASAPDTRHGFAINGHPKTWTGKIVSLDAWRQLSEWDKHGSSEKVWNGLTRQWEAAE